MVTAVPWNVRYCDICRDLNVSRVKGEIQSNMSTNLYQKSPKPFKFINRKFFELNEPYST